MRVYQFSTGVHPFLAENSSARSLATSATVGKWNEVACHGLHSRKATAQELPAVETSLPNHLENTFRDQCFSGLLRL
jgi:hypothetical protein